MRGRWWRVLLLLCLLPWGAAGHVGSPDVFYDGTAGPYPVRITIRMPSVVPGRAEISARVQGEGPVKVSFLPLYSRTAVTNAPPPDPGLLVPGETNLYSGELWLMSVGAYSIEARVEGATGSGSVQIPVNSVAIRQLPLPVSLEVILLSLGSILVLGGLGVIIAAARESTLSAGAQAGPADRRRGWRAGVVTLVIFILLLVGGDRWWKSEEAGFRKRLREGAWPDLETVVRTEGSGRVLRLTLGPEAFGPDYSPPLLPDHGKLLHFFLILQPSMDAFAHLHPVRKKGKTFEVTLPPLPEGRYEVLCDLTLEGSGMSSTATNFVDLPPIPSVQSVSGPAQPDADDSWAVYTPQSVPAGSAAKPVYEFPTGERVAWKPHSPLRARHDAGFEFAVEDGAGHPLPLESYMGMISHTAVLRDDGTIFAHLHPSGNFSMAAQMFFEEKKTREARAGGAAPVMDHSQMGHAAHPHHGGAVVSSFSLPYEFPTAGNYRVWVQFKTGGRVMTAVFDAAVAAE